MRCGRARLQLTGLMDGVLNTDVRGHVEAHLEACNECTNEFRELLSVYEAMKGAYNFKAPAGFSARVMEKLPAGDIGDAAFAGTGLLLRLRASGSKSLQLAATAVVVLVVVLGIVFGGFLSNKLFTGRGVATPETGPDYLFSLVSLDYMGPAPPESIAVAYFTMKEGGNER